MDSTHPQRVYDDETRKAGGTNADDLTDLLRDLPVLLVKENTNWSWHREDELLRQKPALVVVHRSCFFDATYLPDADLSGQTYPFASDTFKRPSVLCALGGGSRAPDADSLNAR